MSYLSVAMVNGHPDQGQQLKSGLKFINHHQDGKKRFSSVVVTVDLRPFSAVNGSDMAAHGEDRRKQAEESIRQVMYMNCWAPS